MGRKKKNAALQEKIDKYLRTYELDALNEANDYGCLVEMCRLELNMEKYQDAIDNADMKDTRSLKDLQSALKDATASYVSLQSTLKISRSTRESENDESPYQYIMRLQDQAKKVIDLRFKKLTCKKCGQVLGKYYIYVPEKGESGSISSKTKAVEPYKYTFRVQCWKCGEVADESNEDFLLIEK